MQRLAIALSLLLAACVASAQPCDDYVNYMCDCHPEDPNDPDGVDCADLSNQFSGTDPTLEDECISSLDEQKNKDDASGWDCPS